MLQNRNSGAQNPQNVWVLTPSADHYRIADWAINGGVHIGVGGQCLWYMDPSDRNVLIFSV